MTADRKENKRKHAAEDDDTVAVKSKKSKKKSTHRETSNDEETKDTVPYKSQIEPEGEERALGEADAPKRSKKVGLGEDGSATVPARKKKSTKKAYLSDEMVVDSDCEPEGGSGPGISGQGPEESKTTAEEDEVAEVKKKPKKKRRVPNDEGPRQSESQTKPTRSKTQAQASDDGAEVRPKPSKKKTAAAGAKAALASSSKKHAGLVDDSGPGDAARNFKKAKSAAMVKDTSKSNNNVDHTARETPTAATATVSHLLCPQSCHPVIATTTGVKVVSDATFLPYTKKVRRGRRADEEDVVLHSTTHRALDYIAQEERPWSGVQPLKHYLAAWDPETGSLEVIEAKKMTLRGVVRSKQAADESLLPPEFQSLNRKADLALTFGTRKAKKALEANTLNVISSQKPVDGSPVKLNAASRAFMDSIGQVTSGMATQEMLQEAIDGSKPVPPANLRATEIQDVYNPLDFIGPGILNMVPVTDWLEAATQNEPVQLVSRFVANRLARVASSPEAVPRLRVLRYLYFIIVYWKNLRPGKFGTRRLPQREELKKVMAPAPDVVVDDIKRRFAEGPELRKFHRDSLATYCCALGMVVDNFDMDMYDLREDLQLEQQAMTMYFKEIGARVKVVTEQRAPGKSIARHRAVLRFPLQFPKQRQGSAKNRR